MYGMIGTIPDKTIVSDFLVEFFSEVYKWNQTSKSEQVFEEMTKIFRKWCRLDWSFILSSEPCGRIYE